MISTKEGLLGAEHAQLRMECAIEQGHLPVVPFMRGFLRMAQVQSLLAVIVVLHDTGRHASRQVVLMRKPLVACPPVPGNSFVLQSVARPTRPVLSTSATSRPCRVTTPWTSRGSLKAVDLALSGTRKVRGTQPAWHRSMSILHCGSGAKGSGARVCAACIYTYEISVSANCNKVTARVGH